MILREKQMKFKLSTVALAMLPAMAITNAAAEEVKPAQYSANSLIVTYKAGTSMAQQSAANNGAQSKRFNNILNGRLAKLTVKTDDIHLLMKRLRKHPAIEHVELDEIITLDEPVAGTTTNDHLYGLLWGLENTGQDIRGTVGTEDADIDADIAWQTTKGTKDIVIGVIDTGVDYTHEDLVNNMWTNIAELNGEDGVDDDNNGYVDDIHGWDAFGSNGDPMDEGGHGTHVAGTIGAEGNNGVGVAGVNHEVSIVGCRFLGPNGGSTSGAIECLDYMLAVKNSGVNLKATNNSWGGGGYSKELEDAIEAHNEAGILFVAAAGNGAVDNDLGAYYPSGYPNDNVLAVASTTNKDGMSGFSQWGLNTVDLGAPGSDIASTYPAALNGGEPGYYYMSGTSMATPHVTGVVGLIASMDEDITVAEMKDVLMNSGDPIDALAGKTVSGKRLNAANAIEMANPVWGYNMESAENTVQVVAGSTANFTIDTSARNEWATGTVDFVTSGDLTATVNPTQISVGQSATVSVSTTAETPFGWYNVMVEGETEGQNDNEGNPIKDRSIAYTVDVLPQGMQEFTFAKNESIALPDGDPTGIESVISLADDITTIDTKVWVNIPSGDSSDFKIKLTSPSGTTKTVYNRQASVGEGLVAEIDLGRAFYGEMVAGDWTLKVADEVRLDRATFAGWSITFDGVGELLPAAPVTNFSYEATGLTVAFNNLSTDNNNDIVSYAWNFGDETTSTEQNPTHTFASDSGYEVSLTATDSRGESTTRTKTVWAATKSLELEVPRQYLSRTGTLRNKLVWLGSEAETVSIFRNGVEIATDVANVGKYTDSERRVTETSFNYQVCDSNGICSPEVLVEF